MALIRWEPAAELGTIQNEMNRLFNTFFDGPSDRGNGNQTRRWIPAMDLVESSDHYVLRADLPGLGEDDVTVSLEGNMLTVSGERKLEPNTNQEGYHRLERGFGAFSRSLTLPDGIDPDSVQARFARGVLEVTIPKPEQKKPRQVQIKLGTGEQPRTLEGSTVTDSQANSGDPVAAIA